MLPGDYPSLNHSADADADADADHDCAQAAKLSKAGEYGFLTESVPEMMAMGSYCMGCKVVNMTLCLL